jgi:hypothetical protein
LYSRPGFAMERRVWQMRAGWFGINRCVAEGWYAPHGVVAWLHGLGAFGRLDPLRLAFGGGLRPGGGAQRPRSAVCRSPRISPGPCRRVRPGPRSCRSRYCPAASRCRSGCLDPDQPRHPLRRRHRHCQGHRRGLNLGLPLGRRRLSWVCQCSRCRKRRGKKRSPSQCVWPVLVNCWDSQPTRFAWPSRSNWVCHARRVTESAGRRLAVNRRGR